MICRACGKRKGCRPDSFRCPDCGLTGPEATEAQRFHSVVRIPHERRDLYRAWTEGPGEFGVLKRSHVADLLTEIQRLDLKIQRLLEAMRAGRLPRTAVSVPSVSSCSTPPERNA